MTPPNTPGIDAQSSQRQWQDERRYLNEHRHHLAQLARPFYDSIPAVQGLLVADDWIPPTPIDLNQVKHIWAANDQPPVAGAEPDAADALPLRTEHDRFGSYTAAMAQLARPQVFENRACYRLTNIATPDTSPALTFAAADYFDAINVYEAVAHEFARTTQHSALDHPPRDNLPLRRHIGDPRDLTRRTVIPAASVLTIRHSSTDGPTIVLHHRDSTKVAHGGGLYQVIPVGVFQPTSPTPQNWENDFDLWRFITREYSEELLGTPEATGQDSPLDYTTWPFYQALQNARQTGNLRVYWLGLGIDPLSLATDFLIAAVYNDNTFDTLFHNAVTTNTEGHVLGTTSNAAGTVGIPFTQDTIDTFTSQQPMQAAGAALLHLAWHHRETLISPWQLSPHHTPDQP